jgi:serine/threonine-protein kinase
MAGRVESEHVVEVFDAGFDEDIGASYLVMELLRGEDLGARIKRKGRLSQDEALEILTQVALGLSRTHAEGIIHRDLKPENLFATRRDDGSLRMRILDFGIAKVITGLSESARTTRAFGTPLYMAPEQLSGDGLIDERVDLYALAHVAYTLLVGAPYFEREHQSAKNVFAFAQSLASGISEPATERAKAQGVTLPPAFDVWFTRGTHLDPMERFSSAVEQIQVLAEALDAPQPKALHSVDVVERAKTVPVAQTPPFTPTESSAVASLRLRPARTPWFGIAAGVAVLGLITYALLARSEPVPHLNRTAHAVNLAAGAALFHATPGAVPVPSAAVEPAVATSETADAEPEPAPVKPPRRVAPVKPAAPPASTGALPPVAPTASTAPYDPLDDL